MGHNIDRCIMFASDLRKLSDLSKIFHFKGQVSQVVWSILWFSDGSLKVEKCVLVRENHSKFSWLLHT